MVINLNNEKAVRKFLEFPGEGSFAEVFKAFTPQLLAFFRARGCQLALAEDLAQEVMLSVYFKTGQLRDRSRFRGWVFKIAQNALCRHFGRQSREVETVDMAEVSGRSVPASHAPTTTTAFEFRHWMAFLDAREQEVMRLRFVEEWEYHEIASAHAIPIGTVQWRVFNAKKKLAPYLKPRQQAA